MQNKSTWSSDFLKLITGGFLLLSVERLTSFSMGLFFLEETKSTMLYTLYLLANTVPALLMPVFSGPYLDSHSKRILLRRLNMGFMILYLLLAFCGNRGSTVSYLMFMMGVLGVGSIRSMYDMVYDSFFPVLIEHGDYQKAYSVWSTIETVTYIVIPISFLVYHKIGISGVLGLAAGISALAFFIMKGIENEEKHEKSTQKDQEKYGNQLREGGKYLLCQKGLFIIQLYLFFSCLAAGAQQAVEMPYFVKNIPNGEWHYMQVWAMAMVGRMIGGMIQYRKQIPTEKKYAAVFSIYLLLNLLGGSYLFMPENTMKAMCFGIGILGITSYNIRVSAVQSYIPDGQRGRLQGISQFLETGGIAFGQFLAGLLSAVIPEREILTVFMGIAFISVVLLFGINRRAVKGILNREF